MLKKKEVLLTGGSFLSTEEDMKLDSYRISLDDQIYCNNRYEYQSLIQNYLFQKIGTGGFIVECIALFQIDRDEFKSIEKDFKK